MKKEQFKSLLQSFLIKVNRSNLPLALNDYSNHLSQMFNDKDNQLSLTEKALELACEEINRVKAKFGSAYIRANGYLVDYFKTKAKEMMKK